MFIEVSELERKRENKHKAKKIKIKRKGGQIWHAVQTKKWSIRWDNYKNYLLINKQQLIQDAEQPLLPRKTSVSTNPGCNENTEIPCPSIFLANECMFISWETTKFEEWKQELTPVHWNETGCYYLSKQLLVWGTHVKIFLSSW